MSIEKLTNSELLMHFKDAVCDHNYNPSSESYNKSGFTYDELEAEILKRMLKNLNGYVGWMNENEDEGI